MRTYFAIAILCASSMLAHADQLDDVLARNLAARGGADKLRAIKSLRATGKVTLGGGNFSLNADFGQVIDRPNRVRTEITIQGLTQISASDGNDAWTVSPFQRPPRCGARLGRRQASARARCRARRPARRLA